jgi:hypothetical protein
MYAYHKRGKRGQITRPRCAPADKRMRCNIQNSLGGDLLATALHREEKERKIAEGRTRRGLEPRFVYNFPTPGEKSFIHLGFFKTFVTKSSNLSLFYSSLNTFSFYDINVLGFCR